MILKDLIKYGQETLNEAGISDYENDAKVLAMYAFELDYTGMLMKMYEEADPETEEYYKDYISIRAGHVPCQYITGTQMFMGHEFNVAENVLIPRSETELLVEQALKLTEDLDTCRALDMCCGSGCIGISYALGRMVAGHKRDEVELVDISEDALQLTEDNMYKLGTKCKIIKSDLFENIEYRYDIIMTNPPYIRSSDIEELMDEVRIHEPRLALDGMDDGLYFYRRIIADGRKHLYEGGILIMEIGYDQYQDIRELLIEAGYSNIDLIKDYAGLDRIVTAVR